MGDKRHKNTNWELGEAVHGNVSWELVQMALLMDIRDELQSLNRLLGCSNFQSIPSTLRTIATRVQKKKPKPSPAKKRPAKKKRRKA